MLDPSQRLRQYPDDPEVWEYPLKYMRGMFDNTPCRGCPHHTNECPNKEHDSLACTPNGVWYGEHIEIANRLEGRL